MFTKTLKLLVLVGTLFFSYKSFAQPVFTIQNVKGSCEGFPNGSFEVLVTASVGDINIFYFSGPLFGGPFPATVGTPVLITGLPGSPFPGRVYNVVVQDEADFSQVNVNIISYPTPLDITIEAVSDNTDCVTSNGSIDITPTGGSGSYTYLWEETSLSFTAATQDISGLLGGNYSLTLTDNNTNCIETFPPIVVGNPSPVLFNLLDIPSPFPVCTGSDLVLTLDGSEVGATYEVFRNNVIATGITQIGTGSPLNFTVPFGTFANGNNFKIKATNGICQGDMANVVIVSIVPLPTAATSGGGTVCSGSPLSQVTFTFTGTAPFNFTYTDGTTPVNVNNHATNSFTLNPAPAAGTYSITALSDANGCVATNLGGSVQVIVNPSPTSAVLSVSGASSICSGGSANLIVTIAGGTSPYSITIDNGVGTINNYVSGTAIPVSPAVTTTYNMVGNVTDASGCSVAGSGSATITVNTPPTSAVLSGTATICSGSSTNLIVTITGGTSPYTVTIDNGVGTINNYISGTLIPVSPALTTTYGIVGNVTDAAGCSVAGSGSAVVTVNPSPTSAVLSGTSSICSGGSANLIVTIVGGTSPYSITLDNGIGTINNYVSGTAIPVSPAVTTTYNMVGNVTDANGCSVAGSGSATITVNTPPTSAVLSGTATICSGSSTNLIVTITGGTSPYTVTIDNGVGTINNYVSGTLIPVSPALTTTYSIVGNVTDAAGCSVAGSGSAVVTVNPSPTSAVLSGTSSICSGGSANLIVTIVGGTSPYSITLDNGIGTINNYVSGTAIPVSPAVTTTYNMVGNVTDANGCSVAGSGSATITVNTPPTSAVLSGTATICSGSSTNLTVTITGGTSPYTVTIDNGVGTINNYISGTLIPVSPALTTTYSIVGNVTDAAGCSVAGSGSAVVTVNPSPTSAVLSGTSSICSGGSANLIVTIVGGTSPYSITLDNGIGTINNYVSGTAIPVSPAVTTTYNMVGNVTDANGCSVAGSGSATITVNTLPTSAVLSGTATICSGSSTNLIVTITGGTSPYTVTIDNGVGTINNYVSGTLIPVSPALTTTYGIVGNVTDAAGCSVAGSGSAVVTVNPSMTSAVLSGTATICSGSSTDLTVTITGGTGPYSITLDNGIGVINNYVSGTAIPVSPAVTTTYNMVGNVTDASGCSVAGSGSATITVNTSPTSAVLSGTATICSGSSTNLIVTITGGTSPYTVTIDNGVGTINNYISGTLIPVSPALTTTYSIVGNVTDAAGCSIAGSGSAVVTVNPSMTSAVLSGTATICSGSSTDLTVTITGGTSPYSITINNGVGTINNYVSGTAIPVSPGVTTAYSITGNVTDASGCTVAGSGIATITVTPSPTATISGNATICTGSSTNITVNFTGTGPWSFQYSDGTTTSPAIPSFFNSISFPVSPATTTTYTLVSVSDATVCPGTVSGSALVTVNQNPQTNLAVGVTLDPLCSGGISDVTVSNSEAGVSYQLRDDADDSLIGTPVIGTGATINLPTGVLLATTTFNVLATATGCTPVQLANLATVNVAGAIDAGLIITAAANPICAGSSTNIQVAGSENGVLYQLRNDADNSTVGAAVAGNGGSIDLPTGNLAATTTFNVLASNGTCSIELTDLETVTVGPSPDPSLTVAVTLDPICVGGATTVTVALSQVGVSYQLRDDADDSAVGSAVAGTGATISFPTGVLNTTTTFNILATGAGCPPVELTALATVNVSGNIDESLLLVAAASPICEGTGTNIQIANSEVGVSYQLRNDATDNPIGAAVAGTGLTIFLPTGNLAATTTFNVLATNGACSIELTDLETVNIDVAPDPSLTVGVTLNPLCAGGTSAVTVALSQVGVSYQLRNDADDSAVGGAVVGTGGTINLSTGVLNATTVFNILASSGVCPSVELTTLATVNVAGSVNAGLTVTASATPICAGSSTFIQVEASEAGVNYQLRNDLNDAPVGVAVAGNGGTINLPTGNLAITTTFNVVASNGTCSIELTDMETITVTPSPAINLSVTPASALICPGTSTNIVVAASEVGVSYQLRNNVGNTPVGIAVAGTGGNILLPTGNLAVNTTFNVFATRGTCSAQLTTTATVNIRPVGDPACGGGGSDCTNFSSIQPAIVTQPSCNDRDAGEVLFTISRSDGTPTTFRVIWTINSTSQTKFTSNTVSFDDLSSGLYQYTVIDEGNGKSCGPVDFFLDLKTQVEILDKQVTANVTCFGGTDGNAILSVDGSTTGEYWYKYVLDGIESGAQTFTPGAPLPGGLPADDDDFIIIKVDDNFAFTCPDTVMVRIKHTFPKIDFTVASTDVTTCNGTDGAIQVTSISGGDSGTSALQIRLKKAVPFSVDPSGYIVLFDFENVVAGLKDYTALAQGNYIVDVKDQLDCIQSKPIAVQAPGQVPLSSVSIVTSDATCINEGESGTIKVTISDAGIFKVAISQDQVNVPADDQFVDYNSPSLPSITFNNLSRGAYYLYIKSSTTTCPTRTDAIAIGGVQAISDFDVLSSCDNVNLTLNNITGQQDAPFVIRVFSNSDKFFKIDSLNASSIPLSNSVSFIYNAPLQHSFLINPGTYRFVMIQTQTAGAGTCTLVSDTVVYDVRQGLGIVLGQVNPSFPEPKRTGSIEIADIDGGTRFISATNELYYEISLFDADDDIVIFDWTEVKLNPQNKFSTLYEYLPPGVYRIKVRDASGCVKTLDVEISLDPSIFVPNIFTPNDDNVNDQFEVLNLPSTGAHKLIISNRWGNEVFKSNDYREGTFWDAGETADGIYYYRLQVEGGETYTGWVEILRGSKP